VYDLGLRLFSDNIARHNRIKDRLLKMLLSSIHRERNGEVVNRALLKNVTQMLVDLGISSTQVYEEDFERHFLETSAQFYKIESQRFIDSNSCSDYMKKVDQRLREEVDRVQHYLDTNTEPKIREVTERELITNHMKTLIEMEGSGLVAMLKDDKVDDLNRMYNLLGRVSKGHELMRTVMGEFMKESGKAVVESPDNQDKEKSFVQSLLDLKDKYDKILIGAFNNDKNFQHTMNQVRRLFLFTLFSAR
jgi:cullin 3